MGYSRASGTTGINHPGLGLEGSAVDGSARRRCASVAAEHLACLFAVAFAGCASPPSAGLAAELVRLKVDVIVASGTATVVAKQATTAIPIVMPIANGPVRGLVASLARPGGRPPGSRR